MSLFTDTMTAYHYDGSAWERTVIRGVQWREKVERVDANGQRTLNRVVSVTIPFDVSLTADGNTVLLPGEHPDISNIKEIRTQDGYCTVKAISNNMLRARLKHWKVIAE